MILREITRINLALSWASIFVESWLLLTKRLEVDNVSVFFFCFFILVAFGSWLGTAVEERSKKPNVRIISKGETK